VNDLETFVANGRAAQAAVDEQLHEPTEPTQEQIYRARIVELEGIIARKSRLIDALTRRVLELEQRGR